MNDNKIKRDLTKGSIIKNIWILALPMVIEMLMQSTFNVVDLFWVGKLGPGAIAAVSLAGVILMVYFSLVMGIATSCSAFVARRIGSKDNEGANFIIIQSLILGIAISFIFGSVGFFNSRFFITSLGASFEVAQQGTLYLQVMFAGSIAIVLLFIINGIFRGVGDAVEAMYVLLFSNILNIVLDPMLIFGLWFFPKMGITGAAVATILSRICGIVLQLFFLLRGTGRVRLSLKKIRVDLYALWQIIAVGVPASGQLLLRMLAMLIIMRVVSLFGTFVIAAYGIALRVFQFILFPGFGLGNAAATLVGQNLGAGNPKRAEDSVWTTGFITMLLMGMCAVIFFIFAPYLIKIFNNNHEVVMFGTSCIRIIAVSYLFMGMGVVLSRSFMGAGDTISPFVINGITLWLLQLPLAFFLAKPLGFGVNGIWTAITISNIANVLISAGWFKVGWWKKKVI